MGDIAQLMTAKDTQTFLKRALDSITPMTLQNRGAKRVYLSGEQWLGIRSAPNVITGAPSATRQQRSAYSGAGEGRDVNEPAEPRSHHAGGYRQERQ